MSPFQAIYNDGTDRSIVNRMSSNNVSTWQGGLRMPTIYMGKGKYKGKGKYIRACLLNNSFQQNRNSHNID